MRSQPTLDCTAVDQTHPPAPETAASPPACKRRGNPNLGLAPRCGARTRAGCPCRAPAIQGKLRCRMHGGRSTGPRTPEGRARVAEARTIHGRYSAEWRARNRRVLTFLRRNRVFLAALRYRDRLPPELAARFEQSPPELRMPPYTTGGITAAQDHAMQRAEAEALAPWWQAIAVARAAERANRAAASGEHSGGKTPCTSAAGAGGSADSAAEPHAPEAAVAIPAAPHAAPAKPQPEPNAPERPVAAVPARPEAAPANPAARPLAPERSDGNPGIPAAPPPAAAALQSEPHAPERATPTAVPVRLPLSGRNLRRWQRKQLPKQQAQAGRSRP
jgi:hypothetical protein